MAPRKHIVVLTGAGISAESGLKTFRDGDGLWMGYNVEDVATPMAFAKNPKLVLDFYNMRRKDVAAAQPNVAHLALAALEQNFKVTIITQNIDDLHERAGSTHVLHLHGEIFKMRSVNDLYTTYDIRGDIVVGDVDTKGHQLRPYIVWFHEDVPMMSAAVKLLQGIDYFAVIGTSLQVYPAASLVQYVAPGITKFIVDRKIPQVYNIQNLTAIEKPATEGVIEMIEMLKEWNQ